MLCIFLLVFTLKCLIFTPIVIVFIGFVSEYPGTIGWAKTRDTSFDRAEPKIGKFRLEIDMLGLHGKSLGRKIAVYILFRKFMLIPFTVIPESDLRPLWGALLLLVKQHLGFSYLSKIRVCIKLVDHKFPSEHFHWGIQHLQDGSKVLTP